MSSGWKTGGHWWSDCAATPVIWGQRTPVVVTRPSIYLAAAPQRCVTLSSAVISHHAK